MLISVQNFVAAFLSNVINLKLYAKILGSMWASTPTNCALTVPLRNITFLHLSQCAMTTSHPENSDEYCFRCRILVAAFMGNIIYLRLFAKILRGHPPGGGAH